MPKPRTFAVVVEDRDMRVTIDPRTARGRRRFAKLMREVADYVDVAPVRAYKRATPKRPPGGWPTERARVH